jgi:general secretion pathway protein G
MRRSLPLRQRGFSKFEFALAALVFAVLVGVAANRLNAYQQRIETVAAQQLITSMRSALTLRVAQLTAAQRRPDIAAIADENPIGWLYEKPKNYLGEYYSPDNEKLASGNWYFDRKTRTLVYLLTRRKSFASQSTIFLKFKVKSLSLRRSTAAAAPSAPIDSVSLVQVADQ